MTTPTYNYGLETGINKSSNTNSFYLGLSGSYALTKHWLISTGLQFNTLRQLAGEYSHPSYYWPDSLPPFTVNDSRKVLTLNIPLLLEYKINKAISLQAGPLLNLLLKQSNKQGLIAPMADMRDTVYHSKEINQAISKTTVNQVSIGFTGGISLHMGRFDLNGRYQLLSPYKISNDLGSYKATYQTLQFGIGYRFK
nr:outer membrane beta-barrel protein [Pedobacter sp. ASV19]